MSSIVSCDQSLPKLHVFKLHESPVVNGSYERFSQQWILKQESSPGTSSSEGISPGDVLLIPDLLTGAGEFEGTRFVVERNCKEEAKNFLLLPGGIEYPEFPQEIVSLQQGRNLAIAYRELLDKVLEKQPGGPLSMVDIMGGQTEVEEFWKEPPILRERRTKQGDWMIPLKDCTIVESFHFPSAKTSS